MGPYGLRGDEETVSDTSPKKVVNLALPGIERFLKDVLSDEQLSDNGENLRLHYVSLLENSETGNDPQENEEFLDIKVSDESLETPQFQVTRFDFDSNSEVEKNKESSKRSLREKAAKRPRPRRKGTDSTEESGVYLSTQTSQSEDVLALQVDTRDNSSRDTYVTDSESEFIEWENDINIGEDGYSTGDNIENYLENIHLQLNENGELYMGVLYVREQPGWHKRWMTITDRCLKCFKYRTDEKMLFEIPLQNAKIIPTDRKRSRMFPITLSIPRLKDAITVATTEEQSRQEWIYVINHVIRNLNDGDLSLECLEAQRKISFSTLVRSSGDHSETTSKQNKSSDVKLCDDMNAVRLDAPSDVHKRRTWHGVNEMGETYPPLRVRVTGDESPEMDSSLSPGLAEEESFKELQECLPDILQRPNTSSANRRQSAGTKSKSLSFNNELDLRMRSTSDLSAHPRIKRHGSLANSLSSKAAKVKSKISSSFFKKGKKDDRAQREAGGSTTTFSGYLSRKKGHSWKNRWCVVKDHSLQCYKDFGVGLAELELTLAGCKVTMVPEGEGERPFVFILTADKEDLQFAAENDAELEEWIMVLDSEAKWIEEQTQALQQEDDSHLTRLSSQDTPEETRKNEGTETHPKRSGESSPRKDSKHHGLPKRNSMLGALAHKFGKGKTKHSSDAKALHDAHHGVEDGVVAVARAQGDAAEDEEDMLSEGPIMEGTLYRQVEQNWLSCSVRLSRHALYMRDESATVFKCSLANCIVLDCSDTEPLMMVVRRSAGEPVYLKANTETDFMEWKETISAAVLTPPSTTKRPLTEENSFDEDPQSKVSWRAQIGGDSFDSVFSREADRSSNAASLPSTPVSPIVMDSCPSPRPSTAGDVESVESEDDFKPKATFPIHRSRSAGGIDRLRPQSAIHSGRDRRRGSPLRRTISNALAALDLSPKKRRSKTFAGLGIAASLLFGIKHTSCLHFRNSTGMWKKRWGVLQQGKLHFFDNVDDVSPTLTIPLKECKVARVQLIGKPFAFELKIPSENMECCLATDNDLDVTKWIELLQLESCGYDSTEQSGLDLLNGIVPQLKQQSYRNESKPDVALSSKLADTKNNNNVRSASLLELRRIREAMSPDQGNLTKRTGHESSPNLNQQKATSLEEVLNLLQEQQMLQSLGQTRYVKVKKARTNWKKSAAAILKEQGSHPNSDTSDRKKESSVEEERLSEAGSDSHAKKRATSIVSLSSDISEERFTGKDALDRYERLAEEEKVKALKAETLLRKRRNSLNLEKEVLEKKIEKINEKKGTVKKLLGKEQVVADKDEIIRTQKRLKEVTVKLADVEHDIKQSKTKEAEIMGSINELKTKSARDFPVKRESVCHRATPEERRAMFKHSPQGSISSHESFDDSTDHLKSSTASLDTGLKRKGSKKQASLVALEEELKKISPMGGRKVPGRKRISFSSEGSVDDASPPSARRGLDKRDSSSSDGSLQGYERFNSFSSEAAEGRRRKLTSPSPKKTEVFNVAVDIPCRRTSSSSLADGSSYKGSDHRPSLITALSQIKDFEDFLASTKQ
ncbi:uncharacterized protein LOC5504265 isoform X2 [Nematostella vectensis]|uniref:uncharacterized protein LOC5504265 isoform X2 n=1 Tax=Nematostella vectensis TaxID=45351 RepID=UPI0013902E32|nr:uncharacterized protein LOC5504265 isoform X2 [Nematostella vectensis]